MSGEFVHGTSEGLKRNFQGYINIAVVVNLVFFCVMLKIEFLRCPKKHVRLQLRDSKKPERMAGVQYLSGLVPAT